MICFIFENESTDYGTSTYDMIEKVTGGMKMSKYGEGKIAVEAVKVVEEYGEVSMGELIGILTERMKPSEHDTEIIAKRNDTYFSQKVRNLRSHSNKIFFENVYYDEAIEKYVSLEWKKRKEELDVTVYPEELKRKKRKAVTFYARKIDFDRINEERKRIGMDGEELVYKDQIRFVSNHASEYLKYVRHVSRLDGDGAGYDICSFDENKKLVYIEVKSTTGKKETPFYMSASEYAFFELHKENYIIARVYDFDLTSKTGKIDYISGISFDGEFEKEVSAYKIYYRSGREIQ